MRWILSGVDSPGMVRTKLTLEQVRMILRIYWTDQYARRKQGLRTTPGLRVRLAEQFEVSVEVIKKVISIKHNQHGRRRRVRFKTIALKSIQRHVRKREDRRNGIDRKSRRKAGRPRSEV